jgi:hypothetical protein
VASILPRVAAGDSVFLALPGSAKATEVAGLLANVCSLPFDFVTRQKLGGVNLLYFIVRQLPVLGPTSYKAPTPWEPATTIGDWIRPRVLELVYTSWDLESFARDLDHDGPPFHWDADRRFQLRCELDAAFFILYGIEPDDADYIMDTFPIVRQNDEKDFGTYRTKIEILRLLREMRSALGQSSADSERPSQQALRE